MNFIVGALHLKRKLFKREKSVPSGERLVEDYGAETFFGVIRTDGAFGIQNSLFRPFSK